MPKKSKKKKSKNNSNSNNNSNSKKKKSKNNNNNNNNSNNSNSKKGQKLYKKIKYKLTKEEISSLLTNDFKKGSKSLEIIKKIKTTVPQFKKRMLIRGYLDKDTNKKNHGYNHSIASRGCYTLAVLSTIYIFLDVDKNLKNDGALSFYETDKKTKKKWFNFKGIKKTYIEKDKFIPKTGDIIYVSPKTIRKFQNFQEKDKDIPTKNRFVLEIILCDDGY